MTLSVNDLFDHAKQLPLADRKLLLERLRHTLPEPLDAEIEAAWIEEVERRLDAFDRGERCSIPWDEAKKRLGC